MTIDLQRQVEMRAAIQQQQLNNVLSLGAQIYAQNCANLLMGVGDPLEVAKACIQLSEAYHFQAQGFVNAQNRRQSENQK